MSLKCAGGLNVLLTTAATDILHYLVWRTISRPQNILVSMLFQHITICMMKLTNANQNKSTTFSADAKNNTVADSNRRTTVVFTTRSTTAADAKNENAEGILIMKANSPDIKKNVWIDTVRSSVYINQIHRWNCGGKHMCFCNIRKKRLSKLQTVACTQDWTVPVRFNHRYMGKWSNKEN